ncbi:Pimeloyl-ACP methyl ester carboxylesterase [Microbacterium azadirachtae]|uniref:Pimeloyl-ACP methyl ester carboxylesterase n=2 Tax=Microbacterium azadirachtae TaxID=582680 RepID=A0A1I6G907_9MICO|nr:Pimeloyl-ACP methyl ester carboxylesterase [Microbacterium azadirachtae]SEF68873.1 Pimeloyl-ACP methyl ester carboxylesterase [Microbacterium azadirachtae]SEF69531.1 Pimeloyl-ACP methyl ester carboxylesterase [Microbacterium azadirachtae]SFR38696.1 Pimeloyl-ACP methyl ester carboxylesterase [Microbacterium azadirachtae]
MSRSSQQVPVAGGTLTVGIWDPEASGTPVLAVHGITATHRAWDLVAERLPERRIIAPDLRGRGGSGALPPPYGFAQHVEDLVAVLDHAGVERALILGHSMGAFIATRFAQRHPERVAGVVLVDGGLPITRPADLSEEQAAASLLGPALERLSMTFPDEEAYRAYWKRHPAFGPYWNAAIDAYIGYDLVGEGVARTSSANPIAVAADAQELDGRDGYASALLSLPARTVLLLAPRGLSDDMPLFATDTVSRWAREVPQLVPQVIPDVNHYTIIMTSAGAEATAMTVEERLNDPEKVNS